MSTTDARAAVEFWLRHCTLTADDLHNSHPNYECPELDAKIDALIAAARAEGYQEGLQAMRDSFNRAASTSTNSMFNPEAQSQEGATP